MRSILVVILLFACVPSATRSADPAAWKLPPESARFKAGRGAELATAYCLICHSADYIATQPPLDRAAWNAIVLKMRDKFGAPILPSTIDPLVDYLSQTYGKKEQPF